MSPAWSWSWRFWRLRSRPAAASASLLDHLPQTALDRLRPRPAGRLRRAAPRPDIGGRTAERGRGQVRCSSTAAGPARAAADPLPRRAARRAALVRVPLAADRARLLGPGRAAQPTTRARSPAGSRCARHLRPQAHGAQTGSLGRAERRRDHRRDARAGPQHRPDRGPDRGVRGRPRGSPTRRSRRCSSPRRAGRRWSPRPASGPSCGGFELATRRGEGGAALRLHPRRGDLRRRSSDGEAEADRDFMRRAGPGGALASGDPRPRADRACWRSAGARPSPGSRCGCRR